MIIRDPRPKTNPKPRHYVDSAGLCGPPEAPPAAGTLFGPPPPPPAPQPPAVRSSVTSQAAAQRIAPAAGRLRGLVLSTITEAGLTGVTDAEGAAELDMSGDSWRPRRVELMKAGLIVKRGRRQTPARRSAAVWVLASIHGGGQ